LKVITARIPDSLHRELVGESRKEGVSLNQLFSTKTARPLDGYWQRGAEEGNARERELQRFAQSG